jgi:hypothetical protein
MVFIVCLYNWDYNCDTDFIENILAAYNTLESAVEYSRSYVLQRRDQVIEIEEMESNTKLGSYDRDGNKVI